jgi:beta-lactam-binding protein with PASTA domain
MRPLALVLSIALPFGAALVFEPLARGQSPARTKVPDLRGLPAEIAQQTLRLLGMKHQVGDFYLTAKSWRDDLKPGTVQIQTPQPGIPLAEGGTVACWTFKKAAAGQQVVKTPDLRKLSRKDAAARLRAAGLSPMRDDGGPGGKSDGAIVEDHYPRPGQPVLRGTSVYLKLRPNDT